MAEGSSHGQHNIKMITPEPIAAGVEAAWREKESNADKTAHYNYTRTMTAI